jgi:hypothetical protein
MYLGSPEFEGLALEAKAVDMPPHWQPEENNFIVEVAETMRHIWQEKRLRGLAAGIGVLLLSGIAGAQAHEAAPVQEARSCVTDVECARQHGLLVGADMPSAGDRIYPAQLPKKPKPHATTTLLKPTTTTATTQPAPPAALTSLHPQPVKHLLNLLPDHEFVDISWPNCTRPLPVRAVGLVGINGPRTFTTNDCLRNQTAHLHQVLGEYVVADSPPQEQIMAHQQYSPNEAPPKPCAAGDTKCQSYNYGFNAGRFAVEYAKASGVPVTDSQPWWIDVDYGEGPRAPFWRGTIDDHNANLQGEADAIYHYASAGSHKARIGYYSTYYQWGKVTGGLKNLYPSWSATGNCGDNFTGALEGTTMVQHVDEARNLDLNIIC